VFLVAHDYNPLEDTVVLSARTDEAGEYAFADVVPGLYSLNARDDSAGARIRYTHLDLRAGTDPERRIDTLFAPGTLVVVITDAAYQAPMAVYVPGSDIVAHVDSPCSLALNVPAGRIDIVSYDTLAGGGVESGPNYRHVPIEPGETLVLDTHVISPPSRPSGPDTASVGTELLYRTSGGASSLGHPLHYRFAWIHYVSEATWDTATVNSWGADSLRLVWPHAGQFKMRAQARSALDTAFVSGWSSHYTVNVH